MSESDIWEEKDDQMESKGIIELTQEERKAELLSKIDEEDIEKLQKFSVQQILDLKEYQLKDIFGTVDGIRYFNSFSRLKVKTLLIKKKRNNKRKIVDPKEKEKN